MNRADLALLRKELREELRIAGLLEGRSRPALPPPHDAQAEREICGALLDGRATPAALAPLEATDFYVEFYGAIFATVAASLDYGAAPTIPFLAKALSGQGCVCDELARELFLVRDETPAVYFLRDRVDRVLEFSKARRLIARMQRLDAALRLGDVRVGDALAELAALADFEADVEVDRSAPAKLADHTGPKTEAA